MHAAAASRYLLPLGTLPAAAEAAASRRPRPTSVTAQAHNRTLGCRHSQLTASRPLYALRYSALSSPLVSVVDSFSAARQPRNLFAACELKPSGASVALFPSRTSNSILRSLSAASPLRNSRGLITGLRMERASCDNKGGGDGQLTACSSRNDHPVKRPKFHHRAHNADDAPGSDDLPMQFEDSIPACVASSAPQLTCHVPGLLCTDHFFKVPLDHWNAAGEKITIFAREVVAYNKVQRQLPYLLYLQGGPGFEAPRPTEASGWLKAATNHFRVILLDQRGTGRSTPVTAANLSRRGDAKAQADYLMFFRANSIVADCEVVRQKIVPANNQGGKWSLLGQSFGGFCCLTYLSFAPHGLTEVMLTGGVPPLVNEVCGAEQTYRALFKRVITQNKRYYQRFPSDKSIVADIVKHLASQPKGGVPLPSGSLLTPRYFQTLGLAGLGGGGGFERLHYLLENAWDGEELHLGFLKACDNWGAWDTNPLFLLLHEAIYCNGPGASSSWSAQRVREGEYKKEFDAQGAAEEGRHVYFTGEQIYQFMLEDIAALRPYKQVADHLAEYSQWQPLYDVSVLERTTIPVAAAVYYDDMYVDFNLSQQTLSHVKGARQWVTNEFLHSGIRDDGARIFDYLLNLVRGSVPLR